MTRRLFFFVFVLILSACGDSNKTGPVDTKWDRDACERCQMMLSDRNFSAQVRVFPKNKRSKVYKFDDLGCAVLWLDQKEWKDDPQTEIWVNDYKTRKWIDARKAWYIKDEISPMGYGLGAQSDKTAGALDFTQAKVHIKDVEEKLNIHGGNLEHK
jgi:nitrous oxide reductase accessory protein NosL